MSLGELASSRSAAGTVNTTARPPYGNAPIVEAVIDIQVAFDPDDGLAAATALADELNEKFPNRQPISVFGLRLETNIDGKLASQQESAEQLGWKLLSGANDRILQIQRKGFTYSHMPPYTNWQTFRPEAEDLWDQFLRVCSPKKVTRLALRYINRLLLPAEGLELSTYVNLYPTVPSSFEPLSGLLMQVQSGLPNVDPRARSLVTLASQPAEGSVQPLILDVDVFIEAEVSPADSEIWGLLGRLRDEKNRIFESVLTGPMRDLIA